MRGPQFRQRHMWHQCIEKQGPVGAPCKECAGKHSDVGARAQKTRMWAIKPVHILIRVREENFK
jgi:hypothetical protein